MTVPAPTPKQLLCTLYATQAMNALDDLPDEQIRMLFREQGALLLRGFGADALGMKRFADRFAARFNRDQSRPPVPGTDGAVQYVTEGSAAVAPHSEQANSPFRPDAILFCCTVPAKNGGETLLWDGVQAWQGLPAATREFLLGNRLRFFQRYPAPRWRAFLGKDATLQVLEQSLAGREGVSYFIDGDEALYLEYLCSSVVQTRYGGELALSNSLLLEYHTLKSRHGIETATTALRFESGQIVDVDLIRALEETLDPLTQAVLWQAGDLLMVDNVRYMHGRNAFADPDRQLFSSMCSLNF